MTSELAQVRAALEEAQRDLEEARRDKNRLYDVLTRTQQDATEWRRLLVMSNPKLLPPPADVNVQVGQDGPEQPKMGWWWRLWRRGS